MSLALSSPSHSRTFARSNRRVLRGSARLSDAVSRKNGQVTSQRLVNAATEAQNWLTYSGSYGSQRYSPAQSDQHGQCRKLKLQWVYQSPVAGNWQTSPLVVDG